MTFKDNLQKLKADKGMCTLCVLFVILAFFHFDHRNYTEYSQCYIRCGFCLLIALSTLLFYRTGFSITFLAYAYVLIYFHTFFNYTSFFYVLIAIRCSPKLKIPALILYVLDVIVLFGQRHLVISALAIHFTCCIIAVILIQLFFIKDTDINTKNEEKSETTLNLNDDEKFILSELTKGKLQKQIKGYSVNTVTKHIKNAMKRNNCNSKAELQHRFMNETHNNFVTESQDDVSEVYE